MSARGNTSSAGGAAAAGGVGYEARLAAWYAVRILAEDENPPLDAGALWLTLGDLHALALARGFLTNELRSAISLLLTLV